MKPDVFSVDYWDGQGVFIKPSELESAYKDRAQKMKVNASSFHSSTLQNLYGFSPGWVPVSYNDKGIHFWEAAIAWIDDRVDPPATEIQLRKRFETYSSLYGLYKKEEVLNHEYVHAARFVFQDSKYDEHFCYYTSYKKGMLPRFRTFMGPLFQHRIEVIVLFALLLWSFVVSDSEVLVYSLIALVAYTDLLFIRLAWRWWYWNRCKNNLTSLGDKALHLMVRLTDKELKKFATLSFIDICSWVQAQSDFRWSYLFKRYF